MPHSHAEYPQLTCPQCRAAFTAEVWLIIDTAERPDLLARVIDGSLHRVVCPNGHATELDAPLLLFRPGEEPPLVFSPARETTAEQDQEIAGGLVGQLREALGSDWRDEWLEDAANVPRELLPALLSGDAAALRDAMAAAVRSDELDVFPAFGDDMQRAKVAEQRYLATSDRVALDEAAAAWERVLDNPDFSIAPERSQMAARNNAAIVFIRRYQSHGHLLDLDRSLALWQDVLATLPAHSPHRAAIGNNLGNGLRERYMRAGRVEDLDAAIAAWEFAVANTPDGTPEKAIFQNNLGNGLGDRFMRTGKVEELERAVALYGAAVAATPIDSPNYSLHQNNLGNGLSDLYAVTGRVEDLDAAIAAYEAADAATPSDSPERARNLNNLGAGLSDRYTLTGQIKDLDAAIVAYEVAVARTPPDSPDHALYQSNLANGLSNRYAQTGQVEDLDAAVSLYEAAVAATPTGSPNYAVYQNNLGAGLSDRYARTGRDEDIEASIAAYEAAVANCPPDSPERARNLSNLGNGLRDRYLHTGQVEALEAAIAAHEAAVANTPSGSPSLAGRRNNLGVVLRDRYARSKQAADLERAIVVCQAALTVAAPGFPERAAIGNNLGNGLRDRYARTGQAKELDAAITAYATAVAEVQIGSPDQASYLNNLAVGLSDRYALAGWPEDLAAAIAAYDDALNALDRALLDSPVAFVLGQQSHWAGLYARATTALLAAGRPAEALAVAEGSKSRLLTLLMSRGDLPAPPGIPATLVDAERAAAARLSAIDAAALGDHNRAGSEPGEVIRQRSAARAALVAELRAVWQAMAELGPEAVNYVSLRRGDRPTAAGLARLAGGLPAGTALLSLFDTGETVTAPDGEAGERRRVLLFLLRAGAAGPVVLEAALDPDALYYDYLANYEEEVFDPRRRRALRALGRPLTGRWRALGRLLLGPLLPHLDGIDHLIIAPEGVYHQLPLHALWIGPAGTTLLDHCAVSYIPALGLLERLVGAPAEPGDLSGRSAVFGYTDADPTTERGAREREIFLGEAAAVAGRLGVEPLLDDAATGAALEAATARPLRRLHLSCHGYFNTEDALASGVLLADGAGGSVVYTAREFMTHRLPVELVTLSACRTAISGSLGGDEMAGLSMGLLSAGARSLLLGQWSVNAQTTEKLMDWFYALLDGDGGRRATKAETLRRVMLAFRDGRVLSPLGDFDPADPYFWAPFVLVGDWR